MMLTIKPERKSRLLTKKPHKDAVDGDKELTNWKKCC
jgi:hypothetical protein